MGAPQKMVEDGNMTHERLLAAGERRRSVARHDVIWCFEKILGRPPESEEVIAEHMALPGLFTLLDTLLSSEEFRLRSYPPPEPASFERRFVLLGQAHNDVESEVRPAQLRLCLARIKSAWTSLGLQRPHHSVITSEQYLPERLEANLPQFWRSGDLNAADVAVVAARYLATEPAAAEVSELGCGVGRVTCGLARRFRGVNAYDISAPHLELARQKAQEQALGNVRFHEVAADEIPEFAPCDVFYTRIVLQHNPPPVIRHLIAALLRSVRAGGLAVFHVPTYIKNYRFRLARWLRESQPDDMEMHAIPMPVVFEEIAAQGAIVREVREEFTPGELEMIANTFIVQKP
jgi:SAM-dependent methyltransferase